MNNLDQIRARNALEAAKGKSFKGANDGEIVKKIPAMIRQNGILGALAFAYENDGKTGHADVFRAIIRHLADKTVGVLKAECDLRLFIEGISQADSAKLRAITDESMAYLNYLRRFAKKGNDHDTDRD